MRTRLAGLLDAIASSTVTVVGDIVLDEYISGDADRVSPEAPHPIIAERARRYVPGGAANVAVNIAALGGKARLIGIVGDDTEADLLREALSARGVATDGLITVPGRPTTRKTRLIARDTQVLRVDRETREPIPADIAATLCRAAIDASSDVVIVSDYAKGVVDSALTPALAAAGRRVIVDPKSPDLGTYKNAYLVTPNAHEFAAAAKITSPSSASLEAPARALMDTAGIANMLVTLGPDGMALVAGKEPLVHFHARTREVYDVTGAGDTVIATVAAAIAGGASLADACYVATIAAGIVVGKRFTASASPTEIMAYAFGPTSAGKVVDRDTLIGRLAELRAEGKSIVFTNGCFDLLHVGHIAYLNEARGLGDALVVGINTDRSVSALKGPTRPIVPEEERSHLLAALECVDFVVLFDEETPLELITRIHPDVLVKGADYTREGVVGHDVVESYGGRVALIDLVDNVSTTNIIERIRERT